MIYVLYILSTLGGGWYAAPPQEFVSQQACEAAIVMLKKRLDSPPRPPIMVCVPKGSE